jgi:hypothetical protein
MMSSLVSLWWGGTQVKVEEVEIVRCTLGYLSVKKGWSRRDAKLKKQCGEVTWVKHRGLARIDI